MPRVPPEHLQARRAQILAAAVACFARQGFHRTTMQDIVREARLSPGAIYRYFASKDAIIDTIAAERHAREAALIAGAGGGDLADVLARLARAFFNLLRDPGERQQRRVGVQLWAEALRNPRLLARARAGIERPRAMLARLVRDAQAGGAAPPGIDPDAAARLMIAAFQGFTLQQVWNPNLAVEPYLATIEAALGALAVPAPTRQPLTRRRSGSTQRSGGRRR
jgi:AcrR family transcriptional regulator